MSLKLTSAWFSTLRHLCPEMHGIANIANIADFFHYRRFHRYRKSVSQISQILTYMTEEVHTGRNPIANIADIRSTLRPLHSTPHLNTPWGKVLKGPRLTSCFSTLQFSHSLAILIQQHGRIPVDSNALTCSVSHVCTVDLSVKHKRVRTQGDHNTQPIKHKRMRTKGDYNTLPIK